MVTHVNRTASHPSAVATNDGEMLLQQPMVLTAQLLLCPKGLEKSEPGAAQGWLVEGLVQQFIPWTSRSQMGLTLWAHWSWIRVYHTSMPTLYVFLMSFTRKRSKCFLRSATICGRSVLPPLQKWHPSLSLATACSEAKICCVKDQRSAVGFRHVWGCSLHVVSAKHSCCRTPVLVQGWHSGNLWALVV